MKAMDLSRKLSKEMDSKEIEKLVAYLITHNSIDPNRILVKAQMLVSLTDDEMVNELAYRSEGNTKMVAHELNNVLFNAE